jgi:hypothetical protein
MDCRRTQPVKGALVDLAGSRDDHGRFERSHTTRSGSRDGSLQGGQ